MGPVDSGVRLTQSAGVGGREDGLVSSQQTSL